MKDAWLTKDHCRSRFQQLYLRKTRQEAYRRKVTESLLLTRNIDFSVELFWMISEWSQIKTVFQQVRA